MLKVFDSNAENTAIESVLEELEKNDVPGSEHIILTPDRFSLSVEKKLFGFLRRDGAMNINVYSLTNFAKRAVKGLPRCLTKEGTVMLLKEVLEGEKKNLGYYRATSEMKSFPKELFAVMASIRNSGITPDMLETAFLGRTDVTAAKYRDIALVYRRYQEELQKKYIDTTGRLDALIERAGSLKIVTGSHFYVVGFSNFYKKQIQILEALVKHGKSVNISASTSVGGYNSALFGNRFTSTMQGIKERTGTELLTVRKDKVFIEPIGALTKSVFSYRAGILPKTENVVLYRENTPYDEIKAVGREIVRLVRREGYRYQDIAVVHYDDSDKAVMKDVFGRFGIPYFSDEKYPLKTAMSVRYLSEALAVLTENFRKEAVLAFIKNPLFGVDRAETDAFENYVLKYNINFKCFTEPFRGGAKVGWPQELAREGYGAAHAGSPKCDGSGEMPQDTLSTGGDEAALAEVVRAKLLRSLPTFAEKLTVQDAARTLRVFLSEELLSREAELVSGADEAYRKLHEQSARLFSEQLDEMEEVLQSKPVSLKAFRDMVLSAILSVSVSLIPAKNDCVFVGTGEDSALFGVKALFLVGAAEGVVPQVGGYQAIMPEKDILAFEKAGVPLYPTPVDRLRQEKAKLIQLLSKAEERLYVGYSSFNLVSEPMQESELLKELRSASGWELEKLSDRFRVEKVTGNAGAEDFLVSKENALYEYRMWRGLGSRKNYGFFAHVKAYLEGNGVNVELGSVQSGLLKPRKEALFFKTENGVPYTKASQLEVYASCPYRHFFEYGLRIKEREEAEAKVTDVGTLIHLALEYYFTNTMGKLHKMSDAEIQKETERAILDAFRMEKAEILQETNYGKILFLALKKELEVLLPRLTEYAKNSKFEPKFIEYNFSVKGGNPVKIDTAFGTLSIGGKIDRADAYGGDIFVIDYKTGAASTALKDVYEGRKVQLYLYALPFRAAGYRVVGSYYLPIADGYSVPGKTLQLIGNTLDSPAVAADLDQTYRDGEWDSVFFPLKNKLTKAGVTLDRKKDSRLLTEEQFRLLEKMAVGVIRNSAEEIQSGYIKKRPAEGKCEYCNFRALCGDKEERDSRPVRLTEEGLVRSILAEDGEGE